MTIPDAAVSAALVARTTFKWQRGGDNAAIQMRHILEAAAQQLIKAGWVKPEPVTEWGVGNKWGAQSTKATYESAAEYIEWATKHAPDHGARLIKRTAATLVEAGPWEDAA